MTCKECDKFCRFPKNPKCGLCAEEVDNVINGTTTNKNVIVSEDTVCSYRWAYPQNGIIEEAKGGAE